MRDGEGIVTQRRRGALGRASLLFVNGSSRSIGFGELPRAVTGQATPMLAGGNAQDTIESTVSGGVCQAYAGKCERVPSGETNGGAHPQTITSALLYALNASLLALSKLLHPIHER